MKLGQSVILILLLGTAFRLSAQESIKRIDSLELIVLTQKGVEKAETQRLIGVWYFEHEIYNQSLKHSIEALTYYENHNLDSHAMHIHIILGAIYESTEHFDRAEEHDLIALERFEKYKHERGVIVMLQNLGVLYSSIGEFEKSVVYNQRAIEKCKETKDTLLLLRVYNNLSYTYFQHEEYELSIQTIDTGLIYVQNGPRIGKYLNREIALKVNLAENYVALKKFDSALEVLENLIDYVPIMTRVEARDSYRMLGVIEQDKGNYKKSLYYFQQEKIFNDSFNLSINNDRLLELTVQNEVKYKQQENELLRKEKEITELKLSDQKNKNNAMKLGVLFLGITLFMVVIFYLKTRNKNKQLVEANLEMLASQDDGLHKISLKGKAKKSPEISEAQKQDIIKRLNAVFNHEEVFKDIGLTVDSLAKQLDTNRNYLSIVIKELNPSGFLDFVNEYRIRKSWNLLSNPEFFHLTIEHISKEVGFKSQPTFNKAFKKFTGVTPSFYLKEVKHKLKL